MLRDHMSRAGLFHHRSRSESGVVSFLSPLRQPSRGDKPHSSVVSGLDFPLGREIVTRYVTSCHRTESGLIPLLAGKDLTQLKERTLSTGPIAAVCNCQRTIYGSGFNYHLSGLSEDVHLLRVLNSWKLAMWRWIGRTACRADLYSLKRTCIWEKCSSYCVQTNLNGHLGVCRCEQ